MKKLIIQEEEKMNSIGEINYAQVHVMNMNVIYEGWGVSIFSFKENILCINNNKEIKVLDVETSKKLLQIEFARYDNDDISMSNSGTLPGFPIEIFEKIHVTHEFIIEVK